MLTACLALVLAAYNPSEAAHTVNVKDQHHVRHDSGSYGKEKVKTKGLAKTVHP